jgi:uncharacterized membrane protein
MGIYKPGALVGSLVKRRFGLLVYVLIVMAFGLVASAQGKPWPTGVWLLIALWALVSIVVVIRKTPT